MAGLDKLPDGVSIDTSKKVIECTRSALERLGDWCTHTAQVFGLVLVVTTWADTALAQGANTKTWAKVEVTLVPTWSTPIPTLDAKKLWALSVASVNVPSTSASAAADKGIGVLQYTKDGRDFSKLTPEEVKGLSRNEKELYYAWKNIEIDAKLITEEQRFAENKEKAITLKNSADKEWEKAITLKNSADKEEMKVIAEYQKMIINFTQLHSKRSTTPIYFTMKEDLKKVLISGKPPEILPQLESLRSILMS